MPLGYFINSTFLVFVLCRFYGNKQNINTFSYSHNWNAYKVNNTKWSYNQFIYGSIKSLHIKGSSLSEWKAEHHYRKQFCFLTKYLCSVFFSWLVNYQTSALIQEMDWASMCCKAICCINDDIWYWPHWFHNI